MGFCWHIERWVNGFLLNRINILFHLYVRFWRQLPSGVIATLRKRDEKRILVPRNYSASPALEYATSLPDPQAAWLEQRNQVRAKIWKFQQDKEKQDGAYVVQKTNVTPIYTPPLHKPNSQGQLFSRNGGGHFLDSKVLAVPVCDVNSQATDNIKVNGLSTKVVQNNGSLTQISEHRKEADSSKHGDAVASSIDSNLKSEKPATGKEVSHHPDIRKRLASIYGRVLVVDTVSKAKEVVSKLTHQYRHIVHACDTEVCASLE